VACTSKKYYYTPTSSGHHDFECFYPLPDHKPQLCAPILGPCSWLIAWLLTEFPENVFFKPQKYLQKKAYKGLQSKGLHSKDKTGTREQQMHNAV
jgi:hypothetical protein